MYVILHMTYVISRRHLANLRTKAPPPAVGRDFLRRAGGLTPHPPLGSGTLAWESGGHRSSPQLALSEAFGDNRSRAEGWLGQGRAMDKNGMGAEVTIRDAWFPVVLGYREGRERVSHVTGPGAGPGTQQMLSRCSRVKRTGLLFLW